MVALSQPTAHITGSDTLGDRFVVVGRFGSTYGVDGWIKVSSYTDPIDNLLHYHPWHVKRGGTWQEIAIIDCKCHGQGIIALIEGFAVRETAKLFSGMDIAIQRKQLPPLAPGEFYLDDLLNMDVNTIDGRALGKITQIMETGASEIIVVNGDKQHMIPLLLDNYVKKIDFEQQLVTVDWDPQF